ncbi:hypothetical protein HW115_00405 [Verrucomicrobiaceae bacterium N1E253]|uniref:Biopolymer transporter ExbD n=1 Tax=Oceaniferula marina TaxID=2748318 RepID=A0A851GFJ4_9BACT|nr:biopolymer transporter ExbD [Oceaniferula marina]NWK54055.1 hypothetical protein [Oceaniferula marina]
MQPIEMEHREPQEMVEIHAGQEEKEENKGIAPLVISIDDKGVIYLGTGAEKETLDADTANQKLPLLKAKLEAYSAAVKAAEGKPKVQLSASAEVKQQRVVDVLNLLAEHHISAVTFIQPEAP